MKRHLPAVAFLRYNSSGNWQERRIRVHGESMIHQTQYNVHVSDHFRQAPYHFIKLKKCPLLKSKNQPSPKSQSLAWTSRPTYSAFFSQLFSSEIISTSSVSSFLLPISLLDFQRNHQVLKICVVSKRAENPTLRKMFYENHI